MSGEPTRRSMPSLTFRRLRALALLLVVIGLVTACVHAIRSPTTTATSAGAAASVTPTPTRSSPTGSDSTRSSSPQARPTASTARPSATATHAATPKPATSSSPASANALLADAVEDQHLSGRLSVAVTDLDTGVTASYGAQHRFATASIVKVDILATLLLQRHGKLSGSQRALAVRMIEHSDNDAASALWNQIGRAGGLAAANARFGLANTTGGSAGYWGLTMTTSTDQLRLLRTVFTEDSPLNDTSQRYLRTLMGDVESDQDWGVPAAAADDTDYYVKNGWLPRSSGWIVNSIGSVTYHGHTLLIAELSDRRPSMPSGVRVLEAVSIQAAQATSGR